MAKMSWQTPKKLTLEISGPIASYLRDLQETHLYGDTLEEAVMALLTQGLRQAVADKLIGIKRFTE